jgi:hypothetical protein
MKKVILLLLVFFYKNSTSQIIFFGYGTSTLLTQQTKKLLNSKNDFSYSNPQYLIGFKQKIQKINNINILFQYVNYKASTVMTYTNEKYKEGFGFTGAKVKRFEIGITYYKFLKKIILEPSFLIGIQHSVKKSSLWGGQLELHGPTYFQINPPTSIGINTTQLVPSIGLNFGTLIKNKIGISIMFQGVYGFIGYQKIYFNYRHIDSYNVERQAVYETKGTGLFSSLQIGYKL